METTQQAPKPRRRRRWLIVGAGLLGLACIAVLAGGVWIFSRSLKDTQLWMRSLTWSPDGSRLASGSADSCITIWDSETGQVLHTLRGHDDWVRGLDWSPDGSWLAAGDGGGSVKIWDPETGQEARTLQSAQDALGYLAWSTDGSELAAARAGRVAISRTADWIETRSLNTHTDLITGVAWSPNDFFIATVSTDGSVEEWDARTGDSVRALVGHSGWANDVDWSPDGLVLISVGDDGDTILWSAEGGEMITRLNSHTGYAYGVAWSPDGTMFASAGLDSKVQVVNAATGKVEVDLPGDDSYLTVEWSPDGNRLAAGTGNNTVIVWDTQQWEAILEVPSGCTEGQ